MPRKSRETLNSNYFHVIVQGIEKKCIFEEKKSKEKYLNKLIEKSVDCNIKLLAYCIMDNHAHMLTYTENINLLSKWMQCSNISFALYYNNLNKRAGYVFRNRYKSVPIANEAHLHTCLAYIHLNPVNAKMSPLPELYEFSSYNDFIKKTGIVSNETLGLLNYTSNKYIDNFKFIHYMYVEGEEYDDDVDEVSKEEIIQQYIDENDIKDIIFQSDKVKQMIDDLKKKKISFSKIAQFLGVTNRRLKEIILG